MSRSPRRSSMATTRAGGWTCPTSISRSWPSCSSKPRTAADQLRTAAEKRVKELTAQNPTRVHLVEKLEQLVEACNLGTPDAEAFFQALKAFAAQLDAESQRHAREGLTEPELTVFDLLTRPVPKLTKSEEAQVKKIARDLLEKLQGHVVTDWQTKPMLRDAIHSEIRFTLNELPEQPYPEPLWNTKVEEVWQFVFRHVQGPIETGAGLN